MKSYNLTSATNSYLSFFWEILRLYFRRLSELNPKKRAAQLFSLDNDKIGRNISVTGFYELTNLRLMKSILFKEKEQSGIAIDIGANIGNHTLYFSHIFDKVFAIEPHPALFKVLEANTIWNNASNVRCLNVAFGKDRSYTLLAQEQQSHSGTFRINSTKAHGIKIEIRKGDEVMHEVKESIKLIKIDVEGFESDVLAGLEQTISSHRPIIWFEAENAEKAKTSIQFLRSLGYSDFKIPWNASVRKGSLKRYLLFPINRCKLVPLQSILNHHYSCILAIP